MTSAPWSASTWVQYGPPRTRVRSTTTSPGGGRAAARGGAPSGRLPEDAGGELGIGLRQRAGDVAAEQGEGLRVGLGRRGHAPARVVVEPGVLADRPRGLARMDASQGEARRVPVEAEDAAPGHERDRPAAAIDTRRLDAGALMKSTRSTSVRPECSCWNRMTRGTTKYRVRGPKAGERDVAARIVAGADEVDVRPPVDLAAAEEERVDTALSGAVEQLRCRR